MDELQRQLKAFSKRYGFQGQMMKARIEILMKQGKSPEEAIRQVFKEYGVEDWLQANVSSVIVARPRMPWGRNWPKTFLRLPCWKPCPIPGTAAG